MFQFKRKKKYFQEYVYAVINTEGKKQEYDFLVIESTPTFVFVERLQTLKN